MPSDAIECSVSASTPANGPTPTQITKTMPMISGSIERSVFRMVREVL